MVALLSFRAEIAPGLDVVWDEERPPSLQIDLEDDEHDRLCRAGAPEHWEFAEVSIPALISFMLDKKPRAHGRRDFTCEFSRPSPGEVTMRVSFKGYPFSERTYGDDVYHAALRLCGHGKAFGLLCEAVVRQPGRAFKEDLLKFIEGRRAQPARKKPPAERSHQESKLFHGAAEDARPVSFPSKIQGTVIKRPKQGNVLRPSATPVPPGPLRPVQVRLFVGVLDRGETLPNDLSDEAKAQILAYANDAGLIPPVDEKTA